MTIKISKRKLNKTDEIALHHGFTFEKIPSTQTRKNSFLSPLEKNSVINVYKKKINKRKHVAPSFIYYDNPILINKKQNLIKSHSNVGLDIIGIKGSIAEVIVINTAIHMLREEGYSNIFLDVNCIGDKNSISQYNEELKNYYKKNISSMEGKCGNIHKKQLLEKFDCCEHESCQSVKKSEPKPINFLSETSQKHLKEILEYLEETKIPYRINSDLMSEDNHYSKTIFEIKMENQSKNSEVEEIILARGGRYDDAANKVANKRNLHAVGISLQYKKIKNEKAYSNKITLPQVLLIQFGFKARLKGLEIIEILRHNQVTIHQNMYTERLTDQFELAKKLNIPYVIVIGQKEVQEGELIIKNMRNASHEVISIDKLPQYLKKMNLV